MRATPAFAIPNEEKIKMTDTNLVELRQYTLVGGQRDTLVDLFERAFVETQEAAGIQVFGRYLDLDDPDRFVWMRGFSDIETRGRALSDFYGGPAWAAHREAANATMIDSDNVLLLRPSGRRAQIRDDLTITRGLLRVTIHYLNGVAPERFEAFWTDALRSMLAEAGPRPFRPLATAAVANNFPRLPVRADSVFLSFMRFDDEAEEREFTRWWSSRSGWRDSLSADLLPALMRKPEVIRLAPVAR